MKNRTIAKVGLLLLSCIFFVSVSSYAHAEISVTEILLSGGEEYHTDPNIHGNRVVWTDVNNSIYVYDLSVDTDHDGTPNYLEDPRLYPDPAKIIIFSTEGGYRLNPDIYGDRVVWEEYPGGYDSHDIYMYDLSIDTDHDGTPNYLEDPRLEPDPALVVICSADRDQYYPAIYGNKIVWQDTRNNLSEIYMYDLDNPQYNGTRLCAG